MLKANAWPYPVFEEVAYELETATFQGRTLKQKMTGHGIIVEAQELRELGEGDVFLNVKILTSTNEVANEVFKGSASEGIVVGFRVLCEMTKHRDFILAPENAAATRINIPLGKVRGVVTITPMFRATVVPEDSPVPTGATIGLARDPIYVTIDEDWTGQQIQIDWLDFAAQNPPLPEEAFIHVELSGSGEVAPRAWLNKKFEPEIGTIINHAGLNSPQGLARNVFRQFILNQVWKDVLAWAIKHEDGENENWPATRIASMWRDRFKEFTWDLPTKEDLTIEILGDLSLKVQHCLKIGQELTHVSKLWNF
jgi:hypothetical protein